MYRNSFQMTGNVNNKRRYQVILLLCLVFLISTIVLASIVGTNKAFRNNTIQQLRQRTVSAVEAATAEVKTMGGIVTSNSNARLAKVRQYVYHAEQLDQLAVSLQGESARMIPLEALTAIYDTLDTFEAQVAASTSSTLDTRTLLLSHLTQLQTLLNTP